MTTISRPTITPQDLLRKAADDMEEHGISKGVYFADDESERPQDYETCQVCAYGALWRAYVHAQGETLGGPSKSNWLVNPDAEVVYQAGKLLADEIVSITGQEKRTPFVTVTDYNDLEEIEAVDVVRAMRAAAERQ